MQFGCVEGWGVMATFSGGPEDNVFRLNEADGSAAVTGGGGHDVLSVNWSAKTDPVRGQFDFRYGSTNAYLDDYLGGAQISATDIDRLVVKFGRGNDQFSVAGSVRAILDGGLGTDFFSGNFQSNVSGIAFSLDETADAISRLRGQGSSIANFERVQIFTGGGNDDLTGGALADTFSVGGGNNVVSGRGGDDQILSGGGVNTVVGGLGADRWIGDYSAAAAVVLTHATGTAYALSDGSSSNEVETIELTFGAGDDRIEVASGARQLSVNAGAGDNAAVINWSAVTDAISGSVTGTPGALQLQNAVSKDRIDITGITSLAITFGSGNDGFYLTGPLTATLDGGAGLDFLYNDSSATSVAVRFAVSAMVDGAAVDLAGSTVRNFERVDIRTGSADDVVAGGRYDDAFRTGQGSDSIRSGAGDDLVLAGGGDDLVDGGAGADRLFGEDGLDVLSYASVRSGVTVSLAIQTAQDTRGGGVDEVSGFENLTGSAFADNLTGDDLANRITGGAGNDVIFAGAGDDTLRGGAGLDELYGGFGNDTVIGGDDGDYLEGFDGDDNLRGDAGADFVDGGAGNDQLIGGDGNDRMFAGAGADRLDGGSGLDLLQGGSGADLFIFFDGDSGATLQTADKIDDFQSGERDRIDLRAMDADVQMAGDQAFTFIQDGAFSSTAGELRYERVGSDVIVQGDLDGDGVANFYIHLDNVAVLLASDLLV